ncbi:MAG TPA: hypothetical protein VFE90_21425 [Myxococcales bacterium]|jgi:hypothetical protein|nr:hypothetical protein [Myxococcales bacterium]
MNRKQMILALGLSALCGCAGMVRQTKPAPVERLDGSGISAPVLAIESGDMVQFVNADARPHQIYSSDCAELSSTLLNPGETWSTAVGSGPKLCHFQDLLAPQAAGYNGKVEVHDDLAERRMVSPE